MYSSDSRTVVKGLQGLSLEMTTTELVTPEGPRSAVNEYEALRLKWDSVGYIPCKNFSSCAFQAADKFQVGSHLAERAFPNLFVPS